MGSVSQPPPQEVPEGMEDEARASVLAEERGILRNLAAAIIGIAPSLIYQWTSHGNIKVTSEGLVPISEVRRKTIEWHDKNSGKRAATDEGAIEAKIRGERAKASLAELELEERLGKVVSREAVQARLVDLFSMVKTRLTAMPDAYAAELAAKTDAQDVRAFLAKQIHSVLTILADEAEAGADASASNAATDTV